MPPWLRGEKLRANLRAAFVTFHLVAVVVLTLPRDSIARREAWKEANNQEDFAAWAGRLTQLGVEITPEQLEARLWDLVQAYLSVRTRAGAPFSPYADYVGVTQGWQLFSSPQRFPVELQVDIIEQFGSWRPIYRSRSDEHAWRATTLDHARLRKVVGNIARKQESNYASLARWLAAQAAADYPSAVKVRVRLWRYRALPPDLVRAGAQPEGAHEREIVFKAAELR